MKLFPFFFSSPSQRSSRSGWGRFLLEPIDGVPSDARRWSHCFVSIRVGVSWFDVLCDHDALGGVRGVSSPSAADRAANPTTLAHVLVVVLDGGSSVRALGDTSCDPREALLAKLYSPVRTCLSSDAVDGHGGNAAGRSRWGLPLPLRRRTCATVPSLLCSTA